MSGSLDSSKMPIKRYTLPYYKIPKRRITRSTNKFINFEQSNLNGPVIVVKPAKSKL